MASERILQQVEALEADSNYEGAYALCTNALNTDKNNKDLLEKTAMLAKIVGNTEKSTECWEHLLEIDASNQLAYSELQDIYIESDKFKYYSMRAKFRILEQKIEAGIDDLKKAVSNTDNEKDIIDTRLLIAQLYNTINKPDKAENQYLLILDMGPNNVASMLLADYYAKIGNIEDAIDTLTQAHEKDKEDIQIKKFLGELYLKTGDNKMAEKFVTDDYSSIKVLLQQEKNTEAKELLDKISANKNSQYYLLLAEYFYNVKEYEQCFGAVDEFAKLTPKHPLTFQMRALCYEQLNNEAKAKYNWGWYNLIKGQQDIALTEFLNSNSIEKNVDTLEQIIKIYDAQHDKTTAAEFLAELVELEPQNTIALKRLGDFYQSIGDADSADEYYSRILKYDPNNLKVLPDAAKMAEKVGKETEAMEYYQQIIKLSRDDAEKAKAQKRLNILNGEEEESILSKFLDLIKKF